MHSTRSVKSVQSARSMYSTTHSMAPSNKNYGIVLPRMSERIVNFCRNYLIVANIVLFLASFVTLGVSIFLLIDKSDFLTSVMMLRVAKAACILIIAASSTLILTTLFGLIAFRFYNIYLIIIYLIFIFLITVAFFTGAIFALADLAGGTDWIRQLMRENIQLRYGVAPNNTTQSANTPETETWDQVQIKWYCCGVEDNSWGVYRSSKWYDFQPGNKDFDRIMVPASCCFRNQYGEIVNQQKCQLNYIGPPYKNDGPYNEALYYSGCYTYGLTVLARASRGIVAMGFIMGVALITVLFAAFVVMTDLKQERKEALTIERASSRHTFHTLSHAGDQTHDASFT